MSLVAYDSSGSESEPEENSNESSNKNDVIIPTKPTVNGKRKEPVKILAPALTEIDEDDAEARRKKLKTNQERKSGLLGLLPPPRKFLKPKKTTDLVPHTVAKNFAESKPTLIPKVTTSISKDGIKNKKDESDDEMEFEAVPGPSKSFDFFSLDSSEKPAYPTPLSINAAPSLLPDERNSFSSRGDLFSHGRDEASGSSSVTSEIISSIPSASIQSEPGLIPNTIPPHSTDPAREDIVSQFINNPSQMPDTCLPDELDKEVLLRLQGKSNLGKEDITIIDVHADEQKTDPNVWLTKQLTVEKTEKPRSKGDQLPAIHRRKHQITYLAHQAKERELELKNQWASNRMNRRQTQAKYGF